MRAADMIDGFKESELLAWIEGELPPRRARRLEARVARRPELQTYVEQLRRDHSALRQLDDPELPRDFVAGMEEQLVRPMLMDYRPGEFRRRHQPARRMRLVLRTALAAAVVGAAGVGIWLGLHARPASIENDFVSAPEGSTDAAPDDGLPHLVRNDRDDATFGPAAGQMVHHAGPLPVSPKLTAQDPVLFAMGEGTLERLNAGLVLVASSVEGAEQRIAAAIPGGAFVRNLRDEDARALVSEVIGGGIGSGYTGPADGLDRLNRWAEASAEVPTDAESLVQWRSLMVEGLVRWDDSTLPSELERGLIAGDSKWAASGIEQLRLAGSGATHTLAVRLEDLPALLAELHRAFDGTTRFMELGGAEDASDPLACFVKVRAQLEELAQGDTPVIVQIPIVIQTAE